MYRQTDLWRLPSSSLLTPNPPDSFTDLQHFTTLFVYLTTQDSTEGCQQILQWPLKPTSVSHLCSSDKATANYTDNGAFFAFYYLHSWTHTAFMCMLLSRVRDGLAASNWTLLHRYSYINFMSMYNIVALYRWWLYWDVLAECKELKPVYLHLPSARLRSKLRL